jgi:MFS family permease
MAGIATFAGSFAVSDKPIRVVQISEEQSHARDRRNRAAMLRLVNEIWVNGVLNKSLHNAVLIELGLQERTGAVHRPDRPWDMVLQTTDKPNRVLPPGTRIVDVFDDVGQALLILGSPGSGKTTTLLQLAHQTIRRAEENPTQPIPVVFNLSSWINPAQSIADWLMDELNTKYNIARKIAQPWIENDQLLLLLDGLDEVAEQRRDACVKAINDFRRQYIVPIVICSRTAEYDALTTSLKVHSAVCIQPLSQEQVRVYLDKVGAELTAVSDMLQDDKPMRELSRSPLMLNIMTLAYEGVSTEDLQKLDTIEARREHLFNKYIDRMFNRVARTKNELYPREKTIHWLAWLAQKMSHHGQSVFLIERMQPAWLQTAAEELQYTLGNACIMGVTCSFGFVLLGTLFARIITHLIAQLIGRILAATIFWFFFGSIIAMLARPCWRLFGGEYQKRIETVESFKFSWRDARSGFNFGFFSAVLCVLIGCLFIGLMFMLHTKWFVWQILILVLVLGLILGLLTGLVTGLIYGLVSALTIVELETKLAPNEGVRRSIKNALIIGLIIALIVGLIIGLITGLIAGLFYGVSSGLTLGLIGGASAGLATGLIAAQFYGGFAFVEHLSLRFVLSRNGYLPWNLVRFLDYAADRIFLQKVGGGYIFIHRLLQEHFASLNQSR